MNSCKYKRAVVCIALLIQSFCVMAQQIPYDIEVDGVKVIVKPGEGELVQIMTVIKGGVQNYTAAHAGIEQLALLALTECGTKKKSKNEFKDALDLHGGNIRHNAGKDFSTVTMDCVREDLPEVWTLYTEA